MDFDFLTGTFNITNRRLAKRHVGSTDWDEFPSVKTAHTFFDGGGSFDEIVLPTQGFSGATIRLFDRESEQWSIYWMNSRVGRMEPPVVGRFTDGVGTFYGDDTDEGVPIRVRFTWSRITTDSWRWEQAFSTDDEKTWETNWIMDGTRAEAGKP
jgi:hypothetical protein